MLKTKDDATLEQQKDKLIDNYKKDLPEMYEQCEKINSLYAPQSPVLVRTSIGEDSTNG